MKSSLSWIGNIGLALLLFLCGIAAEAEGDRARLKLVFALSPAGSFEAETQAVTGEVVLQPGKPPRVAPIVVQMGQLKTGIELRDRHLREHLDTGKYPVARMTDVTGSNGKGTGLLEYRSFKKRVPFTYSPSSDKKWVTAKAQLKVSEFGIQDGIRYMGVGGEDDVELEVMIPVRAASAPTGPGKKK
jgi:polyisoprenoid-binding protein YceI